MYVGQRAYILFSDWSEYQVIAALEPKDNPALYQAVIGKILGNRSFIRTRPTHITNRRPDLVPASSDVSGGPTAWVPSDSKPDRHWKSFMSDILGGWIGKWLNTPEMGFWYEDVPQSISRVEKKELS
jgi:hypothetical protein